MLAVTNRLSWQETKSGVVGCEPVGTPFFVGGQFVMQKHDRIVVLVLVSALLMFLGMIAALPLQLFGDSLEYLGMAVSLLRTHNLTWERADLEGCAEVVPPETYIPDTERGHLVRKNVRGVLVWGTHSPYYSLIALPFVAVAGAKGFLVLNSICFLAVLFLLYKYLCDKNSSTTAFVLAASLLSFSSALAYVFWIHTEILVFAALFCALYFGVRRRMLLAGIVLGIALAIRPMCCLALVPIGVLCITSRRDIILVSKVALAACIIAFPQVLYNYLQFGSWNSFKGWASPQLMSTRRVLAIWIDPAEGMIWYYPMVGWCVLRNRWPWYVMLTLIGTAIVISVTCTTAGPSLFSAQIGWRYCMMLFPFFLIMAGQWRSNRWDWAALTCSCFFGGVLLLNAVGNSGVYMERFNLSGRMFELMGIPPDPEVFFSTSNNLTPDIAVSRYLDKNMNLRSKKTLIQIRNAEEGPIIVKLFSPLGRGGGQATLAARHGPSVRAELRDGKVATLALPLTEHDLIASTFPDLGATRVPVGRLVLTAPMKTTSGQWDFVWQKRWSAGGYRGFLYMAGPKLVAIYSPGSRILAAVASEEIGNHSETNAVQSEANGHTICGSATIDNVDFVEGTHSLSWSLTDAAPGQTKRWPLTTRLVAVPDKLDPTEVIMVNGWIKYVPHDEDARPIIGGTWLNRDKKAISWGCQQLQEQAGSWFLLRQRWKPVQGAAYLQVHLGVSGKAKLHVDDLIVSRYLPPAPWLPW